MAEKKAYFTAENVKNVVVRSANTTSRAEPRTEIGREVLRNFVVDFDVVNQAFDRAMKRNVR